MNNDLKVEMDLLRSFSSGHIKTELCGSHINWYGCCRCLDSFNDTMDEFKPRKMCRGLRGKSASEAHKKWCHRCWPVLMAKREDLGLPRIRIR